MTYHGAKELARSFRTVRKNTLAIAEDIPEDKYDFRPTPDCRSVREILAHVAVSSQGNLPGPRGAQDHDLCRHRLCRPTSRSGWSRRSSWHGVEGADHRGPAGGRRELGHVPRRRARGGAGGPHPVLRAGRAAQPRAGSRCS